MSKKKSVSPLETAHFRFALIAPVIQGLYPDESEAAYYRRVTKEALLRPDGTTYQYSPDTLERWTGLYRKHGMDALIPGTRSDKGVSRALSPDAVEEIYRLREKYPRITGTMIHQMLVCNHFIKSTVSVRAVQRFLKENDLNTLEEGKHFIKDKDLFLNLTVAKGKTKEAAVLETHVEMIDIQIPISCAETFGYTPLCDLPEFEYNAEKGLSEIALQSPVTVLKRETVSVISDRPKSSNITYWPWQKEGNGSIVQK